MLTSLPEFKSASCIKVNPDTPQKMVRHAVLSAGKRLICPQPRLRTGFFSQLTTNDFPSDNTMAACTSAGVAKFGKPLSLDTKIKVDMILVGEFNRHNFCLRTLNMYGTVIAALYIHAISPCKHRAE